MASWPERSTPCFGTMKVQTHPWLPKARDPLCAFRGVPGPRHRPASCPVAALGSPQPSHPKCGSLPRRHGWVGEAGGQTSVPPRRGR